MYAPVRTLCSFVPLLGITLVWSVTSSASTLTLSDFSSDSTPAAVLGATLDFSTPVGNQITLSVTNDTTAPNEYFINEIYFNVTADVETLSLSSGPANWDLTPGPISGGGVFGAFDFGLIGPPPPGGPALADQIDPGETVDFVFDFTGAGVDMTDFVTEFSTNPPGDTPSLASAKFVRGPGDDSAFGAVVPEPATLSLLALGLGGLAALGRRRH